MVINRLMGVVVIRSWMRKEKVFEMVRFKAANSLRLAVMAKELSGVCILHMCRRVEFHIVEMLSGGLCFR